MITFGMSYKIWKHVTFNKNPMIKFVFHYVFLNFSIAYFSDRNHNAALIYKCVCVPWLRLGTGHLAVRIVRTSRMFEASITTWSIFSIEIRGSPSRLVDIKLLQSGARDNHVLCGCEKYQSEAIVWCFLLQTVFPICWAKNTIFYDFRI